MSTVLLIAYILILVLQITLLTAGIVRKTKKLWISLFTIEIISILTAAGLTLYYNSLPGYGFMPGLSYFGETLFSLAASIVYGVMFLLSVCVYLVRRKK